MNQTQMCNTTYIPWVRAVLDGLLAVLAPPVAVLEVVDLALGHEGEPRLPLPLLALGLGLLPGRRAAKQQPNPIPISSSPIIRRPRAGQHGK
jgi:hypothetical protein